MKKIILAIALQALPAASFTPVGISPALASASVSQLGDLSAMRKIVADTLALVDNGDVPGAIERIKNFETDWDKNAQDLLAKDRKAWFKIDKAADTALNAVRRMETPDKMKVALKGLIGSLDSPD